MKLYRWSRHRLDHRYNIGMAERIPRQWFPIFRSERLRHGRPIGVRRLGEELVLWRDAAGTARVAQRGCPHRGADLALGKVVGGELQCPYHGFRFSGTGACTAVPCEGPDARIPPRLRLELETAVEEHGFIWLYCRDAEPSEPPSSRPWIDGLPEPSTRVATREMEWNVPFSRAMEGMMDLHHAPFAHGRYVPRSMTRLDPYDARFDERGIMRSEGRLRSESSEKRGWDFVLDVAPPSIVSVKFGERSSKSVGGVVACCPIDDTRTWISIRYRAEQRVPWIARLVAEIAVTVECRLVQVDDHRLLRTTVPEGEGHPRQLVHADKAIGLWQQWRRRALGPARLPLAPQPHAAPSIPTAHA